MAAVAATVVVEVKAAMLVAILPGNRVQGLGGPFFVSLVEQLLLARTVCALLPELPKPEILKPRYNANCIGQEQMQKLSPQPAENS